jgi:hypothetical protein
MNVATAAGAMSHRSRKWWILAAALVLIGTGSLVVGLQGTEHALPGPAVSRAAPTRSSGDTTVPPKVVLPVAVRSTPVELRIPAIALTVSLSQLGLNADGTVQVPTDIQQPGWYKLGPSPGQEGSAVILGHVDSYQGPAVFFKLRSLVAGDVVDVSLADGVTAQFKVTSAAMYLKTDFPDQAVYAPHGFSGLQLVTCGGVFDSQTGHYLSNLVVYTSLVALTPAPAPAVRAPLHA